ncbi:MAG TPA: biopolymer transporter ExbD [Rhodothermales bacterium]
MSIQFTTYKKPLAQFSLAGLTDIVLLLLIFFLLTSNFIPQFGIQVNLPRADAGATTDEQYVTVSITEDGRYYVDQQLTPSESLFQAIRDAQGDKVALVLRADRKATVEQFATVANYARALNLRILMATERTE